MTSPLHGEPAAESTSFTVLLVDDHQLMAKSLAVVMRSDPEIDFRVASVESRETILRCAQEASPDVVLLDLDLGPAGSGVDLVQPLCELAGEVIIVTGTTDADRLASALEAGACGFVLKTAAPEELLDSVHRAARHEPLLSDRDRTSYVLAMRNRRKERKDELGPFTRLTSREVQVLARLMDGKSAEAIARLSFVSEATVRTQIRAILTKLGVRSQLAAVARAHRAGWRPASGTEGSSPGP